MSMLTIPEILHTSRLLLMYIHRMDCNSCNRKPLLDSSIQQRVKSTRQKSASKVYFDRRILLNLRMISHCMWNDKDQPHNAYDSLYL